MREGDSASSKVQFICFIYWIYLASAKPGGGEFGAWRRPDWPALSVFCPSFLHRFIFMSASMTRYGRPGMNLFL
jgi:hypothetical protein